MRLRIVTPQRLAAGLVAAGLSLALSGCYYTSPEMVKTYEAADGVAGTIGEGVNLHNILVVREKSTVRGLLLGTVENSTDASISLQFTAEGNQPETLEIPANSILTLSKDNSFLFTKTPKSGSNLPVTVSGTGLGSIDLMVPVVAPVDYYSDVLPTPSDLPTPAEDPAATDAATDPAEEPAAADPAATDAATDPAATEGEATTTP